MRMVHLLHFYGRGETLPERKLNEPLKPLDGFISLSDFLNFTISTYKILIADAKLYSAAYCSSIYCDIMSVLFIVRHVFIRFFQQMRNNKSAVCCSSAH